MSDKTEELARKLYKAFNDHDLDATVELTHPDATLSYVGSDEVLHGKDVLKQDTERWLGAFPDGKVTIDNIVTSGTTAVVELTGHGTHTGTLVGPAGSVPATGKSVTMPFCEVLEFRDDKVIAFRSYFDSGLLMTQLGLLPTPEKAEL